MTTPMRGPATNSSATSTADARRPTPAVCLGPQIGAALLTLFTVLIAANVEARGASMAPHAGMGGADAGLLPSSMPTGGPSSGSTPATGAHASMTTTAVATAIPTGATDATTATPPAPDSQAARGATGPAASNAAGHRASALVSTGFPWGRMLLAGLCGLLAAQERDTSARMGWATLGVGLGAWGSYDALWRPATLPTPAAGRGASVSWAF